MCHPEQIKSVFTCKKSEDILEYDESNYCDFSLRDADDNPLWYEKELNNRMIDVAVLPCDSEPDLFYLPIEDAEEPFNEETNYQIASNIYIIGYPFANQFGYVPIWKQASVASEPEIDIEGLPYFFADTATKHGMSGSPVVLLENRPITSISNDKGYSRHKTKFIGIYSGRIGANSDSRNDAQLGRIWKAKVIQDIIEENE